MRLPRRGRKSYGESFVAPGERPTRDRLRFPIFLIVFAIACGAGLGYTYDRPAVYEASASLLITPPAAAGSTVGSQSDAGSNAGSQAGAQTVGIVRHALTANDLISRLFTRLNEVSARRAMTPGDLAELRRMIEARRFEETSIVNLRAHGPNPVILPVIVNLWLDLYLESQASSQRASVDDTSVRLERQATGLEQRIARRRAEIDQFRKRHDIVSMQREENRVLARLKGLTKSLNEAKDRELKSRSSLNAIKQAIKQGKPVVNLQDQRRIANLETQTVTLNEKIKQFEQRFTPRYMAMDPKITGVVRQLELVERKISALRREARDSVVAKAEQEYASAEQSANDLTLELEQSAQQVTDFTARFSEHKALTEELAQMELMQREVKQRQVRRQVGRPPEITRIEVLERAVRPIQPVWPHYTRDAAISVAASIVLGFLAVLFYDFFNRPARRAAALESAHFVDGITRRPEIVDAEAHEIETASPPPSLEHQLPRELEEAEIRALMQAVDRMTRPLAGVLLSGLTLEQATALRHSHVDLNSGTIDVPDASDRTLMLPDMLRSAFARLLPQDAEARAPVWPDRNGNPLGSHELSALISCAAHDTGLQDAAEISAETLNHTFITFLVRQGARLSEIEDVTGHLSPSIRAAYARYSPPGPGVTLDQVAIIHPALDGS